MTKKAIIVIGLAALLAATSGVALASGSDGHVRGADGDPVKPIVSTVTGDQNSGQSSDTADADPGSASSDSGDQDNAAQSETQTAADASAVSEAYDTAESDNSGSSQSGNQGSGQAQTVRLPAYQFAIYNVVDRQTGEEQSPRLVFGKYFNACYLTLFNDGTLDICLNPSTGIAETGAFTVTDGIMHVEFNNDRSADYTVRYNDDGDYEFIIVPSGDNDIYFTR